MIPLNEDIVIAFDVDDTLVMWSWPPEFNDKVIKFDCYDSIVSCVPHEKHIEEIKRFAARGHFVMVWSQGGKAWCDEVVKKLGLENFVNLTICKPKWIFDDLDPKCWLNKRYLDPWNDKKETIFNPVEEG